MPYATNTRVNEAQSRAEIERVIRKHLGREASFSYGSMSGRAAIQFAAYGRQIRFELPLPSREEAAQKAGRHYKDHQVRKPTPSEIEAWLEAEDRRRWRCLLLIIKGKLEAVSLRIELLESATDAEKASAFEQEFLASVVVQGKDGVVRSLYEAIRGASLGGQKLLPEVKS
jgi:hypothetical protein